MYFRFFIVYQIAGNSSNPKGQWKLARDCSKKYGSQMKCIPPDKKICEICQQVGARSELPPYAELVFAKFFQGNLTFPNTDYCQDNDGIRIDIIKCNFKICAPTYNDVHSFCITRGKEEKSAYFLDSFYSYSEKIRYGIKYTLREPYVTWD